MVKHETRFPSQEEDCHPILSGFRNDQFYIRINGHGDNIIFKPLHSFSFETVKPFQIQNIKPKKKNSKALLQQSAIMNVTDIIANDDPFKKTIPPNDYHSHWVITD